MAPGIYLSGRLHHVRNFQYRLEKLICTACVTQQRTSRDNILELSAPRGLSTSNISLHKWILFICMLEHICFWTLGIFWSGMITILLSCISYERTKSNTNIIINIEHLILPIIPSTPPMRRILFSFLSYCGLFLKSLNAQKQNCYLTKNDICVWQFSSSAICCCSSTKETQDKIENNCQILETQWRWSFPGRFSHVCSVLVIWGNPS